MGERLEPKDRAVVYMAHCDRDLTLMPSPASLLDQAERLRALLVSHALFYEHIVAFDSGVIYNLPLRDILLGPRFRAAQLGRLVTDGVIVPAHRDAAPSFTVLEQSLRETGTYRPLSVDVARPYAEFLDGSRYTLLSPQADVYGTYTELVDGTMADAELMAKLGLGEVAERGLDYVLGQRDRFGGHVRRTFFYEYADQLESEGRTAEAQAMREFGSALSTEAYARVLGVPATYPAQYERTVGSLKNVPLGLPEQLEADTAAVRNVEAAGAAWDCEVLAAVDYDVISDIRRSSHFARWVSALREAELTSDGALAASKVEGALIDYCVALDEPLSLAYTDRYKEARRRSSAIQVNRYAGLAGGVALTVAGVAVAPLAVPAAVLGVVWAFGGTAVDRFLSRSRAQLAQDAVAQTRRSRTSSAADLVTQDAGR